MQISDTILTAEERAQFALRQLFCDRGYQRFVMSKFEEYDLYARNKDFLVSDSVITFTDRGGRLLALKPDVTLSIIKSTRDGADAVNRNGALGSGYVCGAGTAGSIAESDAGNGANACPELSKLYYNESVYRVPKGAQAFKEITQVGVECIGAVDALAAAEVIELAAESLQILGEESVLALSHMGILSSLIDAAVESAELMQCSDSQMLGCRVPLNIDTAREELLSYVSERNVAAVEQCCSQWGIAQSYGLVLSKLVTCYGTPAEVFPQLETLLVDDSAAGTYSVPADVWVPFAETMRILAKSPLQKSMRVNFATVNDAAYYDGFVFTGYVQGVPDRVLAGGQYDKLMRKMQRTSKAIGFAVYLDTLDYLPAPVQAARDLTASASLAMQNPAVPASLVSACVSKGDVPC